MMDYDTKKFFLTLKANTLEELSSLLQKVEYINDYKNPPLGTRALKLSTKLFCPRGQEAEFDSKEISIVLKEPNKPLGPFLSIKGQKRFNVDPKKLEDGVLMLPDVEIVVTETISKCMKQ